MATIRRGAVTAKYTYMYLVNENDMDTMYSQYAEAQEIPLWCDGRSGELDNSDTEPAKRDLSRIAVRDQQYKKRLKRFT